MVAAAKNEIRSVSPKDAWSRAQDGAATLVDIRDVRELDREGRIPGARHAPRGMLEFWLDPESPYHKAWMLERPLILFCASSWRSALAAKALKEMGLDTIAEVDGGLTAWRDAGLPIDRTG